MIYSVTEIGDMVDFLKNFPFMTMDDYRWEYSIPMIRIMGMDNTRVHYLSEKEVSRRKAIITDDPSKLVNDLGLPVFKSETN